MSQILTNHRWAQVALVWLLLCIKVQQCSKSWKGSPLAATSSLCLTERNLSSEREQNWCCCSGYLPSKPNVHLACAKCPQKLWVRSSEVNDELLRIQGNWTRTQTQGWTGNQADVMALLHESLLSLPGRGERMEGPRHIVAVVSAEIFSYECLYFSIRRWGLEF